MSYSYACMSVGLAGFLLLVFGAFAEVIGGATPSDIVSLKNVLLFVVSLGFLVLSALVDQEK